MAVGLGSTIKELVDEINSKGEVDTTNLVTTNTAQTISGAKTFTAQNQFTNESNFVNSSYCPTFTDIASGIGKSSCFTRGAHMQVITGQIIAPNSGATDTTRGYNTESGKIKFQKITSTSGGQPTLKEMAVLSESGMTIGSKTVATTDQIPTKTSQLTNDSGYLTSHQDISGKANISGGNNFTGKQVLKSPSSDGYSIQADGYVKGSWLQAPSTGHQTTTSNKVAVIDGSGWVYYRTPQEIISDGSGVKQVKLNGETKSPDSTGLVDLGTISGGETNSSLPIYIKANTGKKRNGDYNINVTVLYGIDKLQVGDRIQVCMVKTSKNQVQGSTKRVRKRLRCIEYYEVLDLDINDRNNRAVRNSYSIDMFNTTSPNRCWRHFRASGTKSGSYLRRPLSVRIVRCGDWEDKNTERIVLSNIVQLGTSQYTVIPL